MSEKIKSKKESAFMAFVNKNIFIGIAFLCSVVLMLIVYYCFGIIPFGDKTVLRMDLFHQYGPLFGELYDRIVNFKSFIYSWTAGGGSSFLGNYYNYLSSPIAPIIVLLFGHENIPESIGAMVLIKNAFASATMAYYLKKAHNKNDFSIAAFGIMYSFCGFFIAYYWNIMWIDAMYLLPLVILGLEKLINEKKAKLYVTSLAITFFANYYMAFMVCVFAVLYFILYYFSNYSVKSLTKEPRKIILEDGKEKDNKFDYIKNSLFLRRGFLFGISSILSAAIMAFALLPTYFILQSCSATSSTMPLELTNYNTVFDFLANHLASVIPTIRSSGDTVIPNVYSGILTLVLLPLFYFCKKITVKEKAMTTIMLGIFFFAFNFNIPNYIIHALHFPNDLPFRFSFIYSFFIVATAYKVLINIKEFTGKEILTSAVALVGFIVLVERFGQGNVTITSVEISIVFAIVYAVVLWLMKNPKYYQPTVALLLMCCVFAEAAIANTDNFEITQIKTYFNNGYNEFRTLKENLDTREEGDDYRMELTGINTLMDNSWFGYNGMSMFSSMAYEKFANLQDDLGIKSNYINSYVYNKNTPIYNAMMSLKYIVNNNNSKMNPDFYEYVATTGKFSAYENKYYLPMAYCVDDDIFSWDSSLHENPFLNQSDYWEMATGVTDVFTPVYVSDVEFDNINESESLFSGTLFNFSKIDSTMPATAYVSYIFEEDGNYYSYVDTDAFENFEMTCGELTFNQEISEPYILDLGWHSAGEVLTMNMPIDEMHYMGNITCYVYTLNQEAFEQGYNILKEGAMTVDNFEQTSFGGKVNAKEDCVLYTSVPYDKGWIVTVDGKKAETFSLANDGLLAISLEQGEHTVEFSFRARGLLAGACISTASILIIIVFFLLRRVIRKKKSVAKKSVLISREVQNKSKEITGIDALMHQDLGPDATPEDYEALLAAEREISLDDEDTDFNQESVISEPVEEIKADTENRE